MICLSWSLFYVIYYWPKTQVLPTYIRWRMTFFCLIYDLSECFLQAVGPQHQLLSWSEGSGLISVALVWWDGPGWYQLAIGVFTESLNQRVQLLIQHGTLRETHQHKSKLFFWFIKNRTLHLTVYLSVNLINLLTANSLILWMFIYFFVWLFIKLIICLFI